MGAYKVKDDYFIDEWKITHDLPKLHIRCGRCLSYARFFIEIRSYPELQNYCLNKSLPFLLLCTPCFADVIDMYYKNNPNAAKIFAEDSIFSNSKLLKALNDDSDSPILQKIAGRMRYILTPDTNLKSGYMDLINKPGPGRERARRLEKYIPSCNSFENISFDHFEELYAFIDLKLLDIVDYNRQMSTPSPVVIRDSYDQLVDETPTFIRKEKIARERSLNETSSQSQRINVSTITETVNESPEQLQRNFNSFSYSDDDFRLRMDNSSSRDSINNSTHSINLTQPQSSSSSKTDSSTEINISSQGTAANNQPNSFTEEEETSFGQIVQIEQQESSRAIVNPRINQTNVTISQPEISTEELNFSSQGQNIDDDRPITEISDDSSSSFQTSLRPLEIVDEETIEILNEVIVQSSDNQLVILNQPPKRRIETKTRKRKLPSSSSSSSQERTNLNESMQMAPAPRNIRMNPLIPQTANEARRLIHSAQPRTSGG